MSIQETMVHLKNKENINQVERSINSIEGVQRSLVDVDNMNAVIQFDRDVVSEESLKQKINQFI